MQGCAKRRYIRVKKLILLTFLLSFVMSVDIFSGKVTAQVRQKLPFAHLLTNK